MVARDEHIPGVREVSRWLVPRDALIAFTEHRLGADVGVTVWEVAEESTSPTTWRAALRDLANNPGGSDAAGRT